MRSPSGLNTGGQTSGGRKGRVPGAKLKPDLVWLRQDSDGDWRKVVVDVKITSTEKMNGAFKEKDEKYRVWATLETREKKVSKVVMVPLIISYDGAIHRDTVRRWNDFHGISRLTGSGWPRISYATTF